MKRGEGFSCSLLNYLLLITIVASAAVGHNRRCAPSACGKVTNITHPFRLKDDPEYCGDRRYELACENNIAVLALFPGKNYHVQSINYNNYTIRLVDPGILEDDCSTLPNYSISNSYLTNEDAREPYEDNQKRESALDNGMSRSLTVFCNVVFLECSNPVRDDPRYVDTAPCVKQGRNFYAVFGYMWVHELKDDCSVKLVAATSSFPAPPRWPYDQSFLRCGQNYSYTEIHRMLSYGFEVSWLPGVCECGPRRSCIIDETARSGISCYGGENCYTPILMAECGKVSKLQIIAEDYAYGILKGLRKVVGKDGGDTFYKADVLAIIKLGVFTGRVMVPYMVVKFISGLVFFFIMLIYISQRRHASIYENIEEFLQGNKLIPIRYSYKEIKQMTRDFKEKLGEGGFGSVYKGKLRSGPFVAIKMLGKAKGNGQDFISEVATIGRIHHANVVRLVGFCVEGSKRALVYEFMSNGSLDKFIFSKVDSVSLTYQELFEISLGVARGIAYLHEGCDMQILHFDIKPHNILLDENFIPKVSDFGLAKLNPLDNSIVSLKTARGTLGYMAPELFYKNIGAISYKADVYSFGMLLMEMASQRRNSNPNAEHSSQFYFPFWIYDQLAQKSDEIKVEILMHEETSELAKKMFTTALWCIQLKPSDRPSMNKVVEMLEGEAANIEMPPKPSYYPNDIIHGDSEINSGEATSNNSSGSSGFEEEIATNPLLMFSG
ncbi:LEAF RUST 10 DISEASE-RESISTANCE LOCUS RECEPTOR-LIKE PROTEIN KINASE-like 2.2 [Arachis duranensis]|uniref:LEAF RUST 10 DISEASE-RESISTANCE LOCUS RECEPTOR-LIKE PROTEIN KINASE-like 2.2 n=2 Tax=Arachis TaxID=3817 RepID=A0A6P4E1M8_ARADU|nr:LEAF RUST 10 DISEASE-RESISTANCE LOCUS RECEPTOR-LIKE PROTEIN KINASE-like 2.2 [Arachis duranensis]